MELLKSIIIFVLVSGAVCVPDRLRLKSGSSSGMSSSNQLGDFDSVGSYDKTSASESLDLYSYTSGENIHRRSSAKSSNIPVKPFRKQDKTSVPTKTFRVRYNARKLDSDSSKRNHLRMKYKHKAYMKPRILTSVSKAGPKEKSMTKVAADKRGASSELSPTPAPTGVASTLTTVHISDENDFALLLPRTPNGVSDTESRFHWCDLII